MSSNGEYGSYSFADVHGTLSGPGGTIALGESGIADEGITIAMRDPVNTMTSGADGSAMHSLRVFRGGTITIRALKTGTLNALLSDLFDYQTRSAAFHGRNILALTNPVAGDDITAVACAFQKKPDVVYAVEGGMMEWVFDCGRITEKLGAGLTFGGVVA